MKKTKFLLLLILNVFLLLACKKSGPIPDSDSFTYSNLVDSKVQNELVEDLTSYGIDKAKLDSFLDDLNLYNEAIENTSLVESGFKQVKDSKVRYDLMKIFEKWDENQPDLIGHNCRLSSFRLLYDYIKIDNPIIEDDSMLFAEKEMLELTDNLFPKEEEEKFFSLFSYIPTVNSPDYEDHLKVFLDNWKEKGIEFTNDKISLVSVVFNSNIEGGEDTGELFIGHTGLVWENSDGNLAFLEKISFAEPYQLVLFKDRQDLNDYLMSKYDIEYNQDTSIPFILENDHLLETFRPNQNKPS